jgi:phospholipid/cholesterol/gamma-HCH transport system permease protein
MKTLKDAISKLESFYALSIMASISPFRRPFYGREILEQMDYVGVGSLLIVFLVSLFIGMALSLQISAQLSKLGLKIYTGRVVGLSIIREMGPVAIALTFAGRIGSGMASEIGSMVLGHQIDVLRVHGVNPIKKLVSPRVMAAFVMLPALTIIGDIVALGGGYSIAVLESNQSGPFYWSQIRDTLDLESVISGVLKPLIFGYLIACIGCYMGLSTRGGARGLRRATTSAVVLCTIVIIVTDFMLTKLLLFAFGRSV